MAPDVASLPLIVPSELSTEKNLPVKVGINGFGRIGRNVFRASLVRKDLEVVAINHTCQTADDVIYLILHDSTHGPLFRDCPVGTSDIHKVDEKTISVNGCNIALITERDLTKINWKSYGVGYVAECTGKFTKLSLARGHIYFGHATKVVISAPSPDAPTFVYKVNSTKYPSLSASSDVVSNASCTTNCIAPIAKIINDAFGINQGFLTTVHASTKSQSVLDGYSKRDRRSGRAALGNIIPTTTGAAKAISSVLPELSGKITGISIRVPTTNVSMVDFTVNTEKSTSIEEVLSVLRVASKTVFSGVVEVVDEELVSCDFLGNPCSAVVDAPACLQLNDRVMMSPKHCGPMLVN